MSDTPSDIPLGTPFSRAYLRPEQPLRDSMKFRIRTCAVFQELKLNDDKLVTFLKMMGGIEVPYYISGWYWEGFFKTAAIADVLDAIGLIFDFHFKPRNADAKTWKTIVENIFLQESLGYRLDEKCAVRRLVDDEFQRNRFATIAQLGSPRYRSAMEFYNRACLALEEQPVDTLTAVRGVFDANEEIFKLMRSLPGGRLVEGNAREAFGLDASAAPAATVATKAFANSFANWVTACQQYRHAPGPDTGDSTIIGPPEDLAIALFSAGSVYLRDLIARDQKSAIR